MKRTVVIVDDSKFLLRLMQEYFQEVMDFEVVATGVNGVQGVDLYRRFQPDLICLDLTMPVKDGQTALTEILGEFPEARVLIISAVGGPSILRCIKLGAKAYLEKPFRLEDEEFRKDFRQTLLEIFAK
ncbi:MAG TPA: response regulator [Fibrobacteria bacterium]|nr:response regulator [Fibrobacteria bacterium]